MEPSGRFGCFVPNCLKTFDEAKSLICHIKLLHSNLNITKFSCKVENCFREFDRCKYFEKHLATHGREAPPIKRLRTSQADVDYTGMNTDDFNATIELNSSDSRMEEEHSSSLEQERIEPTVLLFNAVSNSVTKFLAKLYSKDTLTRRQIQEVVEDVKDLFCGSFLDVLQDVTMKAVHEPSKDNVTEVQSVFSILRGMFDDVDTEWKRHEYFSEKNSFIRPEKYTVGTANEQKTVAGQIVLEPVLLTGTFISTRKILTSFLELPGVLDTILSYMRDVEKESDIMKNVVQGSLWKDIIKPKFEDKLVLPLTLSFDDFETNKDLGSHATVHKLSACHISISCLPPEFLSRLENMFLTLLFHSSDKAFGLEQVFRPLLFELKSLEDEGIELTIGDVKTRVFFALCLLVGDNLGMNTILGLVESFVANFFCRICKIPRDLSKVLTHEPENLLRDRENYERDLQLKDPSATGVKAECIWNQLASFFITENVYVDIMHDVIEGIADYDLCFIIEHMVVVKKLLTFDELNDLVQGFYYGNQEFGNKPPLILAERVKKESLGFSASELLCLVRFFPLMVGHKIGEDDPVWNFYLCLREIVDIIFAPTISRAAVPYLTQLISRHHESYLSLSKRHLRPKYHNALHYGRVIKCVGPLMPIWAMRWESNYKELRQAAHVTSCRKNISLTLATKSSLKFCARLIDGRGLDHRFQVSPHCDRISISSLDDYENFVGKIGAVPEDGYWNVAKWVKVDGTHYKPGMVVVLCLDEAFPCFGTIELVVVTRGEASFLVKELITVRFNAHLHAYLVEESSANSHVFIKQASLHTHTPAHQRLFADGRMYVMPRNAL